MNAIPTTPSSRKKQRADASVRAHGTLSAFMLGAQMIIDGTGRAAAQAGNAIYLTAAAAPLCALLLHALLGCLRRRHDLESLPAIYRAVWGRFFGGVACVLTSLVFLMDMLCALSALSALGNARLLPVHHADAALVPALFALMLVIVLAEKGLERLAFLSRRVVPAALLALSVWMVRRESVSNLFPLLGLSLPLTARSALFSSGAAACVLASGFAPVSLARTGPGRVRPLLIAGLCACALLFLISLSTPQSAMLAPDAWPVLLIHTGVHTPISGVIYLSVVLLECFALLLALCGSLSMAVRALCGLCSRKAACVAVSIWALLGAAAVSLGGSGFILSLMPIRFVPALLLPSFTLCADVLHARRRRS